MNRVSVLVLALLLLAGCAQWSADASESAVDALRESTTVESTATTASATPTSTAATPSTNCRDGHDRLQTYEPLAPLPSAAELQRNATGKLRVILDRGKLIAGVDENTLLLGFRNPSTGKLEGFEIDLIHALANALFGNPDAVQFKTVTTAQKVDLVALGQVDLTVSAVSINCDRREGVGTAGPVEFSAPYFQTVQRVMVEESSDIRAISDLDGRLVCVTRGSTSTKVLEVEAPKVEKHVVDTRTECLADLQRGQTDAIFTHETFLWGFELQDPKTRVLPGALSQQYYGVAINQDDVELVRVVNAVIEQQRSGALEESYDRWFRQCDLCAPIADVVPKDMPVLPPPDYGRPVP